MRWNDKTKYCGGGMTLSQKSQIISGTASSSGIKTPLKGLIPRLTERVITGNRVLRPTSHDVAASVQAQDGTVTEQGLKVAELACQA